jgi:hypothetical protein
MNASPQINELAAALAKAQAAIKGAVKDSANPFFKSKYADLASVWDACRKPLTDNGLSVAQFPKLQDGLVVLTTMLMHASGQFLSDDLNAEPKDTSPQGIGSTITYLRRYALAAVAGVAPEDDDGEAAEGRTQAVQSRAKAVRLLSAATRTAPAGPSAECCEQAAPAGQATRAAAHQCDRERRGREILMHADQYIAELKAQRFLTACSKGFRTNALKMAFRKRHNAEIEALPLDLRNRVVCAWDNSGPKELRARRQAAPNERQIADAAAPPLAHRESRKAALVP